MEDSLGRKIDVSNMNLAQIKSMISSMMTGNVKKSDFKTIPDQNVQALSRLGDLLKKLNSSFDRQVAQINDYVAGMKNVIREINESRKETENATREAGRTFKELDSNSKILNSLISKGNESLKRVTSAGSSRLNISISAMTPYLKAMTGSLQGMSSIFNRLIELWKPFVASGLEKGSIYVHDIYAQALLREIAKHQGVSGSDFSDIPDKLKELQALAGSKDSKELEKVMKKQNDKILKNLTGGTNKKGIMFGAKTIREMSIISGTSDFKEALEAAQLDETQITAVVDAITRGNISGKQLKTQLMSQGFKTKDIEAVNDAFKSLNAGSNALSRQGLREATNMLETFTDNLFALDEKQSLYASTLGGTSQAAKYVVDYQKALYETTGLTSASVEAQRELFNINNQIYETGVEQSKAEAAIVKNLKNGLRLNKESQKVVNAQLLTEKQIGIESGSLTDDFRNLVESLKFSSIEVSELGRGIANVAKSANLSGEAMKDVVAKTNELSKTLKSQGTFTAQSNTQIAGIVAEAKKLDALDPVTQIFQGLEDMAAGKKELEGIGWMVRQAIDESAMLTKVQSRTLLSSATGTREFAEALEKTTKNLAGGVSSLEEYEKLVYEASKGNKDAEGLLIQIQSQFTNVGVGVADAFRAVESLKKGSSSATQKLSELNALREKGLITEKEMLERANVIRNNSSMTLLGALGETVKYEKDISGVMQGFSEKVASQLSSDAEAALGKGQPVTAEAAISKALSNVQAGLKDANMDQLQISEKQIKEAMGNKDKLAELISTIQKGEAQLRVEQQAASNPLSKAALEMSKLNATLTQMTNSLFFQLQATLGPNGFLYLGLGSVFATAFLKSKTFLSGPLGTAIGKQIGKIPVLRNIARVDPMAALTNSMAALTHAPVIDPKTMTLGKALKGGNFYAAIEQIGIKMEAALPKVMNFGRGFRSFFTTPLSASIPQIRAALGVMGDALNGGWQSIKAFALRTKNSFATSPIFTDPTFWTRFRTSIKDAGITVSKGFLRYFTNNPFKVFYKDLAFLSTKGAGLGLQALGKSLNAVPVAGQIAAAAIGFTIGAFQGFNNTARNFDGVMGSMKDKTLEVTASMKLASTVGGGLAGAIDFLTFGILGITGAIEPLEKVLTWLTYSVTQFFVGIFDGFMEGIAIAKPGLDFFFESFSDIFTAISEIGDVIAEAFGLEGGAGGLVKTFFDFMYKAGKLLGNLIGGTLGVAFSGLGYILGGLAKVISFLLRLLKPVIKLIGGGFASIFTGLKQIFTGDIFRGIGNIFMGIYEIILSPFTAIINWLTGWTGNLYDIIKGAFAGILKWIFGEEGFEKTKVYFNLFLDSFKKGFQVLADFISNLWGKIMTGLTNAVPDWLAPYVGINREAKKIEEKSKKVDENIASQKGSAQQIMEVSKSGKTDDEKLAEAVKIQTQEAQKDVRLEANAKVAGERARKEAVAESERTKSWWQSPDYAGAQQKGKAAREKYIQDSIEARAKLYLKVENALKSSNLEEMINLRSQLMRESAPIPEQLNQAIDKGLAEQAAKTSPAATAPPAPATTTPTQQATAASSSATATTTPTQQATAKAPAAATTTTPTQQAELKLTRRVGDPMHEEVGYGTVKLFKSNLGTIMVDEQNNYYKKDTNNKWQKLGVLPAATEIPGFAIGSELIKKAGLAFLHAGEIVLPADISNILADSAGSFTNKLANPIIAASNMAQAAPSENGPVKSATIQQDFDKGMQLAIMHHRTNLELFKEISEHTEESRESLSKMIDKMEELVVQAKKANEDFGDMDSAEYIGNSSSKIDSMCNYGLVNGSAVRNG